MDDITGRNRSEGSRSRIIVGGIVVAVLGFVAVLSVISSNPSSPSSTVSNPSNSISHWSWGSSSSGSSASSSSSSSGTAQCLDGSGNPVDWWFTYKLPDGYKYAYIDANSESSSGPMQVVGSLSDSSNGLIQTLNNLASGSIPHLFYNDQPPTGSASSSYGHTKGVVGVSEDSAFWILHSTPHFPAAPSGGEYSFPSGETDYGQTFLCMTISASEVNSVGSQLLYTRPYVYTNTIPSSTLNSYSSLSSVISGDWERSSGTNSESFNAGGKTFTSYAKNSEWDSDIYEDLVAPALSSNLIVESWMRGEQLGTYCSTESEYSYSVVDVKTMQADESGSTTTWTETRDHSKWCVTSSGTQQQCVCDINRMTSQRARGGGCICFEDSNVFNQLTASISSHNNC